MSFIHDDVKLRVEAYRAATERLDVEPATDIDKDINFLLHGEVAAPEAALPFAIFSDRTRRSLDLHQDNLLSTAAAYLEVSNGTHHVGMSLRAGDARDLAASLILAAEKWEDLHL